MGRRGRLVAAVCSLPSCGDIFTRTPRDLARARVPYCSRACRDTAARTGKTYTWVACWGKGCKVAFQKLQVEVDRCKRNFCSVPCYLRSVDRAALGRLGGAAPKYVAPDVRFRRSQLGGLARARKLSPERIREISLRAVRARLEKRWTGQRSAVSRKAFMTQRFGPVSVLGVRLGRGRP
jgi:hypothetical protein